MELDWSILAESGFATYLRNSRWGYAAVNTAHVLGITLLVGSIVPLDLRLLGFWRSVPLDPFTRVLPVVAATGLILAMGSGALLFSVRPSEYAMLWVFQLKMALLAIGAGSALSLHIRYAGALSSAPQSTRVTAGAVSLGCWLGALILGRMIAFAAD